MGFSNAPQVLQHIVGYLAVQQKLIQTHHCFDMSASGGILLSYCAANQFASVSVSESRRNSRYRAGHSGDSPKVVLRLTVRLFGFFHSREKYGQNLVVKHLILPFRYFERAMFRPVMVRTMTDNSRNRLRSHAVSMPAKQG
jgi:hypothetical protein